MKIEKKKIGPAVAERLLLGNTRNRLINKRLVTKYASDMSGGNWQFIGDPIRLAADGTLLDGQHRLEAVRISKTTQEFLVISDLPESSQAVMDTGRPRRLGDVLRINGEKHHTLLAASLTYLWGYDHDVNYAIAATNWRPSTAELLDTLAEHPGLRDSCAPGQNLATHLKVPPSIVAFRHYQFGLLDEDDRDDFWHRLLHREFEGNDDPLAKLYVKMLEDAANNQRRLDAVSKHALIVKTWNFYRIGDTVKQLKWSRGGRTKEAFPTAV